MNTKNIDSEKISKDWITYTKLIRSDANLSFLEDSVFQFDDLIAKKPKEAWAIILLILRSAEDDLILSNLAAGPLEDILVRNPEITISWVEEEARGNPRFKELLKGVWKNAIPDKIWERVQIAIR